MSTVIASLSSSRLRISTILLAIGFLSIGAPTIVSLAGDAWSKDDGVHGPIVLATAAWLIWRRRYEVATETTDSSATVAFIGLGLSLFVYAFGRAFDFLSLEVFAMLSVGVVIAYSFVGLRALQALWFPIFYLFFLVPMPGWLIDQITAPLKEFVSYSAEMLLSWAGYAIVRQGIVLYIDQYQLLVKDACAGLNSLFSLTSISLFYIYLRHNASWQYALFLVLWIIPIAVVANILRVIALVLITHYLGEATAQGFLHNSAGMFMFIVALLGIFALDSLFSMIIKPGKLVP